MHESTRQRLTNPNIWIRGLYMIFFLVAYHIAQFIIVLMAIFQFVLVLFTGRANQPLLQFGRNLAVFVEQVFEFLTFNIEEKPFPFEPFPDEPPGGDVWLEDDRDTQVQPDVNAPATTSDDTTTHASTDASTDLETSVDSSEVSTDAGKAGAEDEPKKPT